MIVYVWLLESRGEDCEGGRVLGVYSTLEKACAVLLRVVEREDWRAWNQLDPLRWQTGCDWLEITRREVT